MGLLRDLIINSINEKRQAKRQAKADELRAARQVEIRNQYERRRADSIREYERRRAQSRADYIRRRDEQRQYANKIYSDRLNARLKLTANKKAEAILQKQEKSKQARFDRRTKRRVDRLLKNNPELVNTIMDKGGDLEIFVNSKNPKQYLKNLTLPANKQKPAGSPVNPNMNPEPAQTPQDLSSKFVDPDDTTVNQINEPATLPPQLTKFQDVDDAQDVTTEPSSGQPDAPQATISPVAQEPARPPASPQPVQAQAAPPKQRRASQMSYGQRLGASMKEIFSPSSSKDIIRDRGSKLEQQIQGFGEGAGIGMKKALHGAGQLGAAGLEKLGIISKAQYDKFTKGMDDDQKKLFTEALTRYPKASPGAVKAGVITGEITPYLAGGAGIGAGKTVLGTVGKLGALGAGTGAGQFVAPGQTGVGSRGFNIAAGSILGAAGGAVVGTLSRLAQGFTRKGAKVVTAQSLKQAKADKMTGQAAVKAGRRLGVDVPLAEATQHPSLISKAVGIRSLSPKPKATLTSKVLGTERQLAEQVNRLVERTLKGKSYEALKSQASKFLTRVGNKTVPKADDLLNDPVIANHAARIVKNPDLKELAGKPKSFKYFQTIRDELRGKANKLATAGDKGPEYVALKNAAKKLDGALKTNRDFRIGMKLSQRYKIYDKWTKEIGQINKSAGRDQGSLKQVYNKLFSKDEVFNDLVTDLKAAGVNTQPAKDLRLVLNRLSNSPLGKLMSRQTELVTGMAIDQGPGGVLMRSLHAVFKRRYNNELIRLMTSKKWDKELANIAKIKSTPRMVDRLAKLLTVVGAKTPGMATRDQKKRNK